MVQEEDADGRTIRIHPADCNQALPELLANADLKGPTFCLLDQRTTECHWSTVQALASYQPGKHKIELFYFLMAGWKNRSLKNKRDDCEIKAWWGNEHYFDSITARPDRLAELFRDRFRNELGYRYCMAFPIFGRDRRTEYWMIHATDHPEAIDLMRRSYKRIACGFDPAVEQEEFWSDDALRENLKDIQSWDGLFDNESSGVAN